MSPAHYAATKSYSRPTETFTVLLGVANYSTPTAPPGILQTYVNLYYFHAALVFCFNTFSFP